MVETGTHHPRIYPHQLILLPYSGDAELLPCEDYPDLDADVVEWPALGIASVDRTDDDSGECACGPESGRGVSVRSPGRDHVLDQRDRPPGDLGTLGQSGLPQLVGRFGLDL